MEEFSQKCALLVYWFLCFFIGGPLLVGMIHFEKFGGDPMKRNIIDMVFQNGQSSFSF